MLNPTENLASKLAMQIAASGIKPADVARACGVTPQAVNGWIRTGRIGKQHLPKLANLFGKPLAWWLDSEQGALDNLSIVKSERQVPLISWVQAGRWKEVQDQGNTEEQLKPVTVFHSKPGRCAFALVVEGDSMTAQMPPSFPAGCVVIFDPEVLPKVGDFVVAKDVATQKATFKRLTSDGNRFYLKPLNPAYPVIEIDDPAIRVIAVAIEWQMGGKL